MFLKRKMAESRRSRSRTPPPPANAIGSQAPSHGKQSQTPPIQIVTMEEYETLRENLQLVQAYLVDAKKMEEARQTLLDFQQETIYKAQETLQNVTEKMGNNPYIIQKRK